MYLLFPSGILVSEGENVLLFLCLLEKKNWKYKPLPFGYSPSKGENVSVIPFGGSSFRRGKFRFSCLMILMFKIVEPQRWVNLLKSLFAWMQSSVFWSHRIPVLADVFVFTYPVYLLALYIYWMVESKKSKVEGIKYKIAALYIVAGTALSFIVNIGIQFFVDKVRPYVFLWLADLKNETILNTFMPTSSFPSDHAAVTMGIAMMSLFRGIKNNDKKFLRFGGILIIFSLITSFARVTSGVHWPTDIIAGSLIWILVPLFIMWRPIYTFGTWIAERIGKII